MSDVSILAKNVDLDADVIEKSLSFIDYSSLTIKASMQRDFEAGSHSEIEATIRFISSKGREFGVPTPITDIVYAALLPIEINSQKVKS
ncbi:MAG: hypothetical protein A2X25_05155 [Chloroflexi bacterium GWB2_49_20]|nr:MAG: hypothetical protein A2X25_05155 [Chloroflexi bacterium GWB2_49_20]OGN78567.1 MAG: hypothetical protein A2X26_12275 [Chloroflexi bacterium GWC2_49_37]OGN83260.1 MAG: hypothetical protein A2X27_13675 [Chloroflexi bacterium GWD2_49_16]HBG75134.1 hypothetical protein [Anaerolineae bacterium]HCC78946.1 hypothetical protein [Anaerolineae bacterium]